MMSNPLYDDPVVAEIHAIRAKMLAECDGDIRQMMRRVRDQQCASGLTIRPAPNSVSATSHTTAMQGSCSKAG